MHTNEFYRIQMPAAYTREDAAWIQSQLALLPFGLRLKTAEAYASAYQEAFDAEPVSYRQENAGRRVANRRLREYCKRHIPAIQGYTVPPPQLR